MPNSEEAAGPGPSGGSAVPQDNSLDGPVVPDNKIDDASRPAIAEAPPGPNTSKILPSFGMRKNRAPPVYLRSGDYEQKYQPDRIEDALGPNARVWHVYLDEAQVFDNNMIEGWRDTIDVLLVFAGLFSAVVTTFVVQTSQNLQPDYSEISALLLSELVGLQRAMAEGQPLASVPLSSKNATSFVAQKSDQWINGLWFTSLALSLATALMSVLVKQWLQYYMTPVSGPIQEQVHVRQFRYTGVKLWHVGGIIGCLPVLMHLALVLFYIGLVVLAVQLDKGIAAAVAIVAGLVYIAYFATNLWAVINK
ncbi:hypothetical protein EWM64_g5323 [Hericium alpestre]|uniref:DUF6535 domain-containing protein n=1 Tax=Hericium alpestre TaxID=135208 RepID=A0A4Y9ZXP9_9AGAM|nr:hypothetical protein EWM64_g5323 [Hericium alpestre]